jgi:hypothetical protein
MNATALLLSCFLACGSHGQVSDTTRHFRIAVPELSSSGTVLLVLHDVTVPNNRPVTLRAYAVAPDSSRMLLGSGGLPAIAPDAKGSTTHPALRISVTSGLQRWLEAARGAKQVEIEVKAEVLPDTAGPIAWSVSGAELVPAQ